MTFLERLQRQFDRWPRLKKQVRPLVRWYFRTTDPPREAIGAFLNTIREPLSLLQFDSSIRHFLSDKKIGRNATGNLIVMLAVADLRFDPRIEREARALSEAGYRVVVIFPKSQGWDEANVSWGDGISFVPIPGRIAGYSNAWPGFLSQSFFRYATEYRPFAFHAHDLNTAFIGIAAARKTGAHVICDFHEWFSENVSYNWRDKTYEQHAPRQKQAYQWLERRALANASATVTVCDSIADAMASELGHGRRPTVVRNIPTLSAVPTKTYLPLKQQLGLAADQFVVLWQGGTGPSRMIEPLIESLRYAPSCTLVIRGPSLETYGRGYEAIAQRGGFQERLVLQPPVPSRDVVAAAIGADAGIWTLPNLCRNFSFALPNKIFEYLTSGLPLLVADYPEARLIVETHDVGLTFDPYDPKSIAIAINQMIDDTDLRGRLRANTKKALAALDADHEWSRLVHIYDSLPVRPPN